MKKINITKKQVSEQISEFFKSERFRIILLIIIATLVRIYRLSSEVFRTDEANYVPTVFVNTFRGIIPFVHSTEHPPFYFIFYNVWGKVFGISQIALISLSVVAGIISIVLIYFIVKKLFKNKDIAFVSALLTCFSLYHFHFSRDATEYSFFPMMIFLSTYAFLVFIETKPKQGMRKLILNAGFYVLSTAALFYTHYYAFMIIIVHNLAFFIFWKKHRKLIKTWTIMSIVLLVLIMPEIGYTYEAAHMYGKGLKDIPPTIGEYTHNVIEWQARTIYYFNIGDINRVLNLYLGQDLYKILTKIILVLINFLIIIGILLSVFKLNSSKKKKEKKGFIRIDKDNLFAVALLLLLFFVPLILTSIFPSVFRIKALMYTVLVYNTSLASGIWKISRNRWIRIILVAIIILIGVMNIHHSLDNHYFFGEEENWKGVSELLKNPENRAELIIIHIDYNMAPFFYEYNISLVDDVYAAHYYPTDSSESKLITVPTYYIKNITGRTVFPNLITLNSSLKNINDLWLVSSIHANHIYPNRDVFKILERNFENVSEYRYGSVYATRYKRK